MSARRRRARRPEAASVSALFDDPAAVDRALVELTVAGVPRDLIEVVVSPEAAARYYPGRTRRPGRESFRYAGAGALIGLIAGAALSLLLLALPGFAGPGTTSFVQLLGPNITTVTGAVVGALIGLFVHRRAERRYARAAEAPDRIVVVVTARSEADALRIVRRLEESGGQSARLQSGEESARGPGAG